MVNPDIYPITHEFEKQFEEEKNNSTVMPFNQIVDGFAEAICEYEHGTVNPKDCEGVTLKQYKEVATDLILFLRHKG